jgi:hypothetical protein
MKLLMAVEESQAGIVSYKIDLGFLVAAELDNVLDHSACWLSSDAGQLEAMPMQVDGMDVVAFVARA